MKIDFVSNNFTGNLIVTVFNLEDIFEVRLARAPAAHLLEVEKAL